jgi:hypothetical protein
MIIYIILLASRGKQNRNLIMTSDGKILEQPLAVPAPEDNVKPLNYREQFSVCCFVVFASVDV